MKNCILENPDRDLYLPQLQNKRDILLKQDSIRVSCILFA